MKLRKLLIIIILINILFSCKGYKNYKLSGNYQTSRKLNFADYLFLRSRGVGESLHLYKDGTYHYSTCTTQSIGRWKVKKKKLLLICEKTTYKNDSLYAVFKIDTLACEPITVYKIKRNRLLKRRGLRHITEFIKVKE